MKHHCTHSHTLYVTKANSLVTLGIGFSYLLSAFTQLVDFAIKYLTKIDHSDVEIYSFVPIVGHVIAILVQKLLFIK